MIVSTAMNSVSVVSAPKLPSVSSLKRTVQRKRKINIPQPENLFDLEIPHDFTVTKTGENFLKYDSGPAENRILIFTTDQDLQKLQAAENWFADGTFKTSPKLFYQLYSLHSCVFSQCVPHVYALLPNKTTDTYRRLFEQLKVLCPNLRPQSIMCDFEVAAMNAFEEAFPTAALHGCLFHMSQNVYKHVQEHGLRNLYSENPEFALKIRMLPALSFVPVRAVHNYFDQLVATMPDEAQPIFDYFEDTYVGRERRNRAREGRFPLPLWNNFRRVRLNLPRSNNAIEAWHRRFHSVVSCDHPTIWKLISFLQAEQAYFQRRMEQLVAGNNQKRKRKSILMDKRISTIVSRFNVTDPMEYLRGLAHNIAF